MLCNYKSCSSVPQIKAAGGRSIPSFIEHCTHPCTGHVEYLYNSVSSATRATTKEKETKQTKKKKQVLQVLFDFRGDDLLWHSKSYQVCSPATQQTKWKPSRVFYRTLHIQVQRCDVQSESLRCAAGRNSVFDPFTKCTKYTSVWYKDFFPFYFSFTCFWMHQSRAEENTQLITRTNPQVDVIIISSGVQTLVWTFQCRSSTMQLEDWGGGWGGNNYSTEAIVHFNYNSAGESGGIRETLAVTTVNTANHRATERHHRAEV